MDLLLSIEHSEGSNSNIHDLLRMPWHWILDRVKFLEKRIKSMERSAKETQIGDKRVTFG